MKLFKLPLYFWCNVFREIREMPQCVNASLFLVLWVFFGKNHIFMAFICDMAKGSLADRRYFLETQFDGKDDHHKQRNVEWKYWTAVVNFDCCG